MCKLNSDGHGKEKQDLNHMCCNDTMESSTLFQYMCIFLQIIHQDEDRHLRLTSRLQKAAEDEQYYCRKHDACPNWRVFSVLSSVPNGQCRCCCHFLGLPLQAWMLYIYRIAMPSLIPMAFRNCNSRAPAKQDLLFIKFNTPKCHLERKEKKKTQTSSTSLSFYHSYMVFIMTSICNSSNTFNFIY